MYLKNMSKIIEDIKNGSDIVDTLVLNHYIIRSSVNEIFSSERLNRLSCSKISHDIKDKIIKSTNNYSTRVKVAYLYMMNLLKEAGNDIIMRIASIVTITPIIVEFLEKYMETKNV